MHCLHVNARSLSLPLSLSLSLSHTHTPTHTCPQVATQFSMIASNVFHQMFDPITKMFGALPGAPAKLYVRERPSPHMRPDTLPVTHAGVQYPSPCAVVAPNAYVNSAPRFKYIAGQIGLCGRASVIYFGKKGRWRGVYS